MDEQGTPLAYTSQTHGTPAVNAMVTACFKSASSCALQALVSVSKQQSRLVRVASGNSDAEADAATPPPEEEVDLMMVLAHLALSTRVVFTAGNPDNSSIECLVYQLLLLSVRGLHRMLTVTLTHPCISMPLEAR